MMLTAAPFRSDNSDENEELKSIHYRERAPSAASVPDAAWQVCFYSSSSSSGGGGGGGYAIIAQLGDACIAEFDHH